MGNPRNRYYFQPRRPVGGIILLVWGAFVLVVGIDTRAIFSLFWGGILLLIGVLLLFTFLKSRVSGKELDAFLGGCADTVLPEARDFFGLDSSCDPIALAEGYFFHQMPGQLPMARYGEDDAPRSDIGAAQLFFLHKNRLYCYQKQFDLITKDSHVETLVLELAEIAEISGEAAVIPCKTPKEQNIQVPVERLTIRSPDGDGMELQLSQGVLVAAVRLRALIYPDAVEEEPT